jgi:predicted nucleotidyltransferase
MTIPGAFGPSTQVQRSRCDAFREELRPEVDAALAALQALGVSATVFGSFARGAAYFGPGSDIDILIQDANGLDEETLYRAVHSCIKLLPVDVVLERDLPTHVSRAMRGDLSDDDEVVLASMHIRADGIENLLHAICAIDQKQRLLKDAWHDLYSKDHHARAIAMYLQWACSSFLSLLARAVERTDGMVIKRGAWEVRLFEQALRDLPGRRRPLVREAAFAVHCKLLAFRDDALNGVAAASEPERVFALIAVGVPAMREMLSDLSESFLPLDIQTSHAIDSNATPGETKVLVASSTGGTPKAMP